MDIFVSEFITGGGWPDAPPPVSLVREGRAMLAAFVADAADLPGCRIVTTCDSRLDVEPFEHADVETAAVSGPAEERRVFGRLAGQCDATFVIAPEFENILAERRHIVESVGGLFLGSSRQAIELCADKLHLAEHLQRHSIPTIVTTALNTAAPFTPGEPLVVKQRDGAGSQNVFLARTRREWDAATEAFHGAPRHSGPIVQSYVSGKALSVAAIVASGNHDVEVLPTGAQQLSDDGRFRYAGGSIPVAPSQNDEVEDLITKACNAIAGLSGYIGFDLILPDSDANEPIIVEINPRLTTAYLGYRTLTESNLAERILFPERPFVPLSWKNGRTTFQANGEWTYREKT